jgi:hypothetical protein
MWFTPCAARRQRNIRCYRPWVEALENRTLLSVGDGLNAIFGNLQQGLNAHLLEPSVAYSLPLVGQNLGRDSQSQFLITASPDG